MKTKIALLLQLIALVSLTNTAFAQVNTESITQGVVYLKDIQSGGVDGGTGTANGTWLPRNLNTPDGDLDLVSLSSNQFTLQPGVYTIDATAPFRGVDAHKIRLYDVTNSAAVIFGNNSTANSASVEDAVASLNGFLNLTSATTFQLEYTCATTKPSNGLGAATSFGANEVYSVVKITRLR